jgi:hypothetical protein
MKQWY